MGDGGVDDDGALLRADCDELLQSAGQHVTARDVDAAKVAPVARLAAWASLVFLEIHPFSDGNGRAARILIDALLSAVHPVPVPLVPSGASLADARQLYINGLREVPPWDGESYDRLWQAQPALLATLILQSLVASWRRVRAIAWSAWGGGSGPWLGVIALDVRSSAEARLRAYTRLRHDARTPPPSEAQLDAEARLIQPPNDALIVTSLTNATFYPTGCECDCWLSITWLT